MKNKKKIFYIISLLLFIIFIIVSVKNYINKKYLVTVSLGFAIKMDILFFLVPAIISFIIALTLRNKDKTK